jgi:uncharacterized membrane protein
LAAAVVLGEAASAAVAGVDSAAVAAASVVVARRGAGDMARMQRLFANLFDGWFQLNKRFSSEVLDDMTDAISKGEHTHLGEVRFAIESRLAVADVLNGLDARTRAHQVFGMLRVWDTEHNCGVLIYLLMAEHRIEIVADRGIAHRVKEDEWAAMCSAMQESFAAGQWRVGALRGISDVNDLLARHFPSHGKARPDELPDRPVLL